MVCRRPSASSGEPGTGLLPLPPPVLLTLRERLLRRLVLPLPPLLLGVEVKRVLAMAATPSSGECANGWRAPDDGVDVALACGARQGPMVASQRKPQDVRRCAGTQWLPFVHIFFLSVSLSLCLSTSLPLTHKHSHSYNAPPLFLANTSPPHTVLSLCFSQPFVSSGMRETRAVC